MSVNIIEVKERPALAIEQLIRKMEGLKMDDYTIFVAAMHTSFFHLVAERKVKVDEPVVEKEEIVDKPCIEEEKEFLVDVGSEVADFDSMSDNELKGFAKENDIILGNTKARAKILKKIREALV